MPRPIPSGLKKEHVLAALADLDAGIQHPFGAATTYELWHEAKAYSPKAAVGLAFRSTIGRILAPEEFSGGEAPGQANYVLRKLGFTVRRKGEEDSETEKQTAADWSQAEAALLVSDYFSMLEAELYGRSFKKSDHRKALAPKLQARSDGSIEFKHQNVSGVLVERGLPYIDGYKPRSNYQGILADETEAFLRSNPELLQRLENSPAFNPAERESTDLDHDDLVEDPPERIIRPRPFSRPWLSRKERKIDFAERDDANRHLGRLGEKLVLHLEQRRLKRAGRDDLANRVLWASQEIGDGLGFDILSFDADDESERMLEVKTTGLGKFFPFYVTGNEVRCSEDIPMQYELCRVFNFARDPRLYILHGSLREQCQLEPVLYRAIL